MIVIGGLVTIVSVEDYSKEELCESHDGKWDKQYNYCDNAGSLSCELMGGSQIDCRPCPKGEYCVSMCISTCELQ